jgi:hypothetical protein
MRQVRLNHQGQLALDLWLGPSRETMDQTGIKWSEPERAARFGSWYAVLRLSQVCAAIAAIASAVLPAVIIGTSLSRVEGGHGVPEVIRGSGPGGDEVRQPIQDLFVFMGPNPNTDSLAGSDVILDAKG